MLLISTVRWIMVQYTEARNTQENVSSGERQQWYGCEMLGETSVVTPLPSIDRSRGQRCCLELRIWESQTTNLEEFQWHVTYFIMYRINYIHFLSWQQSKDYSKNALNQMGFFMSWNIFSCSFMANISSCPYIIASLQK